jgi:putative DNA primase/helicase
MMSDIAQRAMGRWQEILPLLGVDRKYLGKGHGPCPMCGGKDRWRFDNNKNIGSWICTHCGAGDGFTLLCKLHGWSFKDAAQRVEAFVGVTNAKPLTARSDDGWQRRICRETWGAANHVTREDAVTRYLDARGLPLADYPRSLRSAAQCRFQGSAGVEYHPAMLAQIVTSEGEAVGLHRTYLDDTAFTKMPIDDAKRIFGRLPAGAAVRLAKPATTMGIAEGIENALAAKTLWGIATWAALTAERLMTWEPPADVKEVFVFADNDVSYTGQAVGYGLARKLHARGITVRVYLPDDPGDWNEALLADRGVAKQE